MSKDEKNGNRGGIGVRLTFVTIDKRAKLWHHVSCLACIRIEFVGALYQKISEYGANSHKCQPDPFFRNAGSSLGLLAFPVAN